MMMTITSTKQSATDVNQQRAENLNFNTNYYSFQLRTWEPCFSIEFNVNQWIQTTNKSNDETPESVAVSSPSPFSSI